MGLVRVFRLGLAAGVGRWVGQSDAPGPEVVGPGRMGGLMRLSCLAKGLGWRIGRALQGHCSRPVPADDVATARPAVPCGWGRSRRG